MSNQPPGNGAHEILQHSGGSRLRAMRELLSVSLRLGLTSFGGPIAHLGYFREEYVKRKAWLDERAFADLIALCQFLPGPASSQVGISIGMMRAGLWGGIASWIGFTLPSALALSLFAYALQHVDPAQAGWLHGLMIVAVAVVAQAVWGMARTLAPDKVRGTLALAAAVVTLCLPSAVGQLLLIACAGLFGWFFLPRGTLPPTGPQTAPPIGKRTAVVAWVLFFGLLCGLQLLRRLLSATWLAVFDSFFRVGSLVFGGGHVVLPMLQAEVVPPGWLTNAQFLAGYGAAQAVPGPLFTFAAYLGAVIQGWSGAIIATIAIFLPSFLLLAGALPFWYVVRRHPRVQAVLQGVNACVVGILLAALYNPVWTKGIHSAADLALALAAFALLVLWKLPPWVVVLICALAGALGV